MEFRIANWITRIVGSSYFVLVSLGALFLFVADIVSGKYDVLLSPSVLKWFSLGILYTFSMYLVYTLPNKNARRGILSWSFSIIFHSSLIWYIAIELDLGGIVFALGTPEAIILILSLIGFFLCIWDVIMATRNKRAKV